MTFESTFEEVALRMLERDPERAKLYSLMAASLGNYVLSEGEPSEVRYSDLFGQQVRPVNPISVGYVAAEFHSSLVLGDAAVVAIQAGGTPSKDSSRARNQQKLDNVPGPFVFTVDASQSHGADGHLRLLENIPGVPSDWFLSRENIPVEIGTCNPSTLWDRLSESRALVRWPYDCSVAYLLVAGPNLFRRDL